jgi:hypothetical protein
VTKIKKSNATSITIPMTFFTEIENSILKFSANTKDPPNSPYNPDRKAVFLEPLQYGPQIILQNHSNKNGIVLAQKQTCRPME